MPRNDDGTFRGNLPKRATNRILLARWLETEVIRRKNLGLDFVSIADQLTRIGRGVAKPLSEFPAGLLFPAEYNVSPQGCHKAYKRALRREPALAVEEHRRLDVARCEDLILGLQKGFRLGDPRAVEAGVKVLAHKAKILGLDAPKRVEMAGKEGGPLTIELFRRLCDEAMEAIDEERGHDEEGSIKKSK